jgi:hypothetical protein
VAETNTNNGTATVDKLAQAGLETSDPSQVFIRTVLRTSDQPIGQGSVLDVFAGTRVSLPESEL